MNLNFSSVMESVERLLATAQNGVQVLCFGGVQQGSVSSPFEIVRSTSMYKLRRYFPADAHPGIPPVLLVHPMMMSPNMWDMSGYRGAVTILHAAELDPWVIDFSISADVDARLRRDATDHVLALSEATDIVKDNTGQEVHLAGYSQGGLLCYQVASYRDSKSIASVVTFGSPVDSSVILPATIPSPVRAAVVNFLADELLDRLDVPSWVARIGFQLFDPLKSAKSRIDFVRQLHDRELLLPREQQRRFLESEGWITFPGPLVSELLKQVVMHNRMMTGGFAIGGRLITLADITCPVLAFVGELDKLGHPVAVRGIRRAAANAEIYEYTLNTGHFGLIVGSLAAERTWPAVAQWVSWISTNGDKPSGISLMAEQPTDGRSERADGGLSYTARLAHGLGDASQMAFALAHATGNAVVAANKSVHVLAAEALRTLPRLVRLGQINENTPISLSGIISEQARDAPRGEFLLFDGRAHTYEAVNHRIDNVVRGLIHVGVRHGDHIGLLMETRPSALVAMAALSRLGAIAVLLRPDADLTEAITITNVTDVITDPINLEAVRLLPVHVMVLGGGESRDLHLSANTDVIDLEQIDPNSVDIPAWYRPDPGLARDLAFVAFGTADGKPVAKHITNYRWAVSAIGTATTAAMRAGDTVYCLSPLHEQSGLLVSLGGAVIGGSRIALSRGLDPDRFATEIRQYGVTVVTYTWTMMRTILDVPRFALHGNHPIRLFVGSGMPTGLWRRVVDAFAPAKIIEFFCTTDGHILLANVSGSKIGSKGRELPGTSHVVLAAYDPESDMILEDETGMVQIAGVDEVGVLLAQPRGPIDPSSSVRRGTLAPADTWICSDSIFWRDRDGDHWLAGTRGSVIRTRRGIVYPEPISNALGRIRSVDLAVTYGISTPSQQMAVTALTLRPAATISGTELTDAFRALPIGVAPDIVHVVPDVELSTTYRPIAGRLAGAGIPKAGRHVWYFDRATAKFRRLTAAARGELSG